MRDVKIIPILRAFLRRSDLQLYAVDSVKAVEEQDKNEDEGDL